MNTALLGRPALIGVFLLMSPAALACGKGQLEERPLIQLASFSGGEDTDYVPATCVEPLKGNLEANDKLALRLKLAAPVNLKPRSKILIKATLYLPNCMGSVYFDLGNPTLKPNDSNEWNIVLRPRIPKLTNRRMIANGLGSVSVVAKMTSGEPVQMKILAAEIVKAEHKN